ncbi:hypothetical protein Dsin_024013 [Dipteronia sinensis]|uniref:Uncharacterized protein n=1 Tax=Dipteronia sinensis TaxID=43782 RepID=A0AAE0A4Q9_9ROSI|nr:hypothetical protein Dsin_024013 [Dipteronia sinensis]
MQEILKPKWRSSTDPEGSDNKVFSSSNQEPFLLHPVPQDQKVLVASSQFEKKAEIWYQVVYARRVGLIWTEFIEAALDRFLNEKLDVVVYEYHEEFEPPASIIITKPATLHEASVEVSIDTKVYSQSDMPTLPYPNEIAEPETESRSLKEEVKPLDSNETTEPIGIQEETIKATSESKNTRSIPIKPIPNRNQNTPPNSSPYHNHSSQTINLNTNPTPISNPNPIYPPIQTQPS